MHVSTRGRPTHNLRRAYSGTHQYPGMKPVVMIGSSQRPLTFERCANTFERPPTQGFCSHYAEQRLRLPAVGFELTSSQERSIPQYNESLRVWRTQPTKHCCSRSADREELRTQPRGSASIYPLRGPCIWFRNATQVMCHHTWTVTMILRYSRGGASTSRGSRVNTRQLNN